MKNIKRKDGLRLNLSNWISDLVPITLSVHDEVSIMDRSGRPVGTGVIKDQLEFGGRCSQNGNFLVKVDDQPRVMVCERTELRRRRTR